MLGDGMVSAAQCFTTRTKGQVFGWRGRVQGSNFLQPQGVRVTGTEGGGGQRSSVGTDGGFERLVVG